MDKEAKKYIDETAKKILASIVPITNKTGYKSRYRQTEARLYAYPTLLANISRYEKDIEDLKREKITGHSKDLARFSLSSANCGIRLTPEEIQEGKIIGIQIKMERDQKEIEEIEKALDDIKSDDYYNVIEQAYFKELDDDIIAKNIRRSSKTVQRHRIRLTMKVAIKFYGAEALQEPKILVRTCP